MMFKAAYESVFNCIEIQIDGGERGTPNSCYKFSSVTPIYSPDTRIRTWGDFFPVCSKTSHPSRTTHQQFRRGAEDVCRAAASRAIHASRRSWETGCIGDFLGHSVHGIWPSYAVDRCLGLGFHLSCYVYFHRTPKCGGTSVKSMVADACIS